MEFNEQVDRANQAAEAMRAEHPRATAARYDTTAGRIVLELSSGLEVRFAPATAQGLERATADELAEIEISPSGFGLHFPRLDADLYLPALLEGFLGSKSWMASRLGSVGGSRKTPAKTQAAKANGRLGGRPRKLQPALQTGD